MGISLSIKLGFVLMKSNFRWHRLNINNIPAVSAVYAFKSKKQWLYIGQSKNIKTRLNNRHIPFQIAKELSETKFYYYPVETNRIRLEGYLIKNLQPEWNGHTSRNTLGNERYLYGAVGCFCDLSLVNYQRFIEIAVDQFNRFPARAVLMDCNDLGTLQRYLEVTPEQRNQAVSVVGF